jgi:hypothetical protein
VESGRKDHHLVESPRIAQIGHPWLPESLREASSCLGRGVRLHPDIDQIGPGPGFQAEPKALVGPPLRPAVGDPEPPFGDRSPPHARVGLVSIRHPADLEVCRNLRHERRVLGRPAVGRSTLSGHDDRLVAELGQRLDHLQRPLRTRAADRREVVGVKKQPPNWAPPRQGLLEIQDSPDGRESRVGKPRESRQVVRHCNDGRPLPATPFLGGRE